MATNQSDSLRPCPFCGIERSDVGFIAHTNECYLMIKYMGGHTNKELGEAWNTRPIEDKLTAELEQEKDNCGKFFLALEEIYDTLGMDDHTGGCIPEIEKLQTKNDDLTAELAELRAENKSIRHILSLWKKTEAMKEIDRLTAENERLSQMLHDELSQLEIATDLGNKRWLALNDIYENGEKHNTNWCKRKAQEGLGIK